MKKITVCILTSGTGSRLDHYTVNKNKSLLSIKKESILTKIFNNFPKNSKFVISIGYKSQQVKDFVKTHHPKLNVKFVNIKNFSGKKSGPALSLFKCKNYLQTPFFFVSCDTIWKKKIFNNRSFNWMGAYKSNKLNSADYCNLMTISNDINEIIDKKKIKNKKNSSIFVGLAFIKDYKIFWDGFKFINSGEPQVSMGFKNILKKSKILKKINIDWEDTGSRRNYEELITKYEKYNFNKVDQQIYISSSKVTKFFDNKKIIDNLIKKSKIKPKAFPENIKKKNNFISYDFIKGKTFYNYYDVKSFKLLINFLEKNLWNGKSKIDKSFLKNCKEFYFKKTHKRVDQFLKNNKLLDDRHFTYKKIQLLKVKNILKNINWSNLFNGIPKFIHGDLQFDNILKISSKKYKLIDWRPTFGKSVEIGDLYYDYAKLLGGLYINYDLVKLGRFKFETQKLKLKLKIPKRKKTQKMINFFENYLLSKKIDLKKVGVLTGLIFLNMSPLHHHPFDKLLFLYGKYFLQKNLSLN